MDRPQTQWLPPAAHAAAPTRRPRRRRRRSARASGASPRRSSSAASRCCKWGKALLLLLPKAKVLTTSALDARLGRRLRADLGLEVRGRLRRAAVHARDGPLHPAAPRGRQADRAWSSSRSSAPPSARARSAAARSPRRASASPGRSSARSRRPRCCRSPRRPATTSGARSRSPASSSTSSTCCRSCRSTAAARWRRWRRGCGSSASARSSLLVFIWPNPILILIALLGGFETYRRWKQRKAGRGGQRRLLPRQARAPAAGRPASTSG